MKGAYQIIRRPVITEKGLGVKETESTLVFEVASRATKTEIKEAVQSIFKVKVDAVRTSNFQGKERRRHHCQSSPRRLPLAIALCPLTVPRTAGSLPGGHLATPEGCRQLPAA